MTKTTRADGRKGIARRHPKARLDRLVYELPFQDVQVKSSKARDEAFAETIRSIPRGKVATYGQVAAAAGYPRYHRAVARFLSTMILGEYPWQRVLGAGGEIKVRGRAAAEQKFRLKMEGVTFAGKRVNLSLHQHVFESTAAGETAVLATATTGRNTQRNGTHLDP